MARGMWTGIAAGFAKAQERKLLEQERQDKLGLIAQERQDRLDARAQERELFNLKRSDDMFETILKIAPDLALNSTLTPSGEGGGSSGGSSKFLETQLAAYKFPTNAILDLQEKGPSAMQAAIEVLKDNYDPTNPPNASKLQQIADSIIVEGAGQPIDPKEFAARFNVNFENFPEGERAMKEEVLRRALASRKGQVASTFMDERPAKLEDVDRFQSTVSKTLQAAIAANAASLPEGEREAFSSAKTDFEKGDPRTAIELLQARGELKGLMQPLFEAYNGYNIPLGVFEPIRKALEPTPTTQANIPDQALQFLLMNKDNPSIVSAFEQKYGVSAEEYF